MKPKKEKKLGLRKETIRDLSVLDTNEQKQVKGGTNKPGTTQVPVYC